MLYNISYQRLITYLKKGDIMLKASNTSAFSYAIELAKVVCANQKTEIYPCKKTAEDLAEFIRTLELKFNGDE